ncbi:MAG: Ldh family oxidoreductase [Sphaerochaetaceae bacterium]|jgi:LDH2 family malate/lactate/ureidoglycolate dehydrogenase|nr:Ldh family oxidoreductase [Sphaerochaetaceae bacterium]MDC7237451.1 Ldh family oxidoreductase [Sphaerochaetaceae bacterium]MDC7244051.1 Ldh family oxidoreductase [Sphaerochaetaceae bacterium]MDC7249871.1 Ldh family oxidoreductase [Sphaerochaetaceae bacterium]
MKFEETYADNYKDCAWIAFEDLEKFMKEALINAGIPEEDATTIGEVLIESDKRGIDSHGIGRLKPIYIDRIDKGIMNPITEIEVVKDQDATAVLDGHNGLGHVVSKKAMDMAIEKAKKYGVGMVAVRNSTHYGIAGYYALMATKADMIGITGTNARPSIAPTNGVENMMGTNPLTFGIPTDEEFPFILDCATSVSQRGKIEVYGRADKELPEGWVIGRDGKTRTDTKQVLKDLTTGNAALTPLGGIGELTGGYKGYGYAAVVEILSAALQDGSFMKALNGFDEDHNPIPYPLGHFFIAIDPEHFMGAKTFKAIAGTICKQLRNSEKAPGQDQIFTAGEKEYIAYNFRKEHGCPVPPSLQKVMVELRDRWNMDYKWDFEK